MQISQKNIDYAIWYYLRYYPSKKKLAQKLEEKFGVNSINGQKYSGIGEKEIKFILDQNLKNIINEKEVCKAKIKNLIDKGKNIAYIKNNLAKKGFQKELIEEILVNDFSSQKKSILNLEKIYKKILNLKQKGKSKNYIKQKFFGNDFDNIEVQKIIEEIFEENSELDFIKKELEKLNYFEKKSSLDYSEKQKILQKLVRKGFLFQDILDVMEGE